MNSGNNGNSPPIAVAVLAGGSGTRLWPLSTPAVPKPFVELGPLGSLYDQTVRRAHALGPECLLAVGAPPLAPFCSAPGVTFLEEPLARNTAAAVALAALAALKRTGDAGCLVVLPADHHIPDAPAFARTLISLVRTCHDLSALGVLGVTPTGPDTAYGYIERGEPAGAAFRVARFIEKPDATRARDLLATGRVAWNSGMFCFPLAVLREEMATHCPAYWQAAEAWTQGGDAEPFRRLEPLSIDYALMEKTARVATLPAAFPWSDLGTFKALHAALPHDAEGNAGWGPGRVEACRDSLVITRRPQTLVRGLAGVAAVETENGLLVTDLQESGSIRAGVEAILKGDGR